MSAPALAPAAMKQRCIKVSSASVVSSQRMSFASPGNAGAFFITAHWTQNTI
jgi:hypothetical protein